MPPGQVLHPEHFFAHGNVFFRIGVGKLAVHHEGIHRVLSTGSPGAGFDHFTVTHNGVISSRSSNTSSLWEI